VEEETIHPLSQPITIFRQRDLLANGGFLLLPQEPATRLAVLYIQHQRKGPLQTQGSRKPREEKIDGPEI